MIQATCMEYLDPFLMREGKAAEAVLPYRRALHLTNSNLKSNHTGLVGKENYIPNGLTITKNKDLNSDQKKQRVCCL